MWFSFFICSLFSFSSAYASIALPEGQTLPESVIRVRSVHKFIEGKTGFNHRGTAVNNGFELKAYGSGSVVEYGLLEKVSLQLLVPYIHSAVSSLDGYVFEKSSIYQEKYQETLKIVAEKLKESGLCQTQELCVEYIQEKHGKLPYGKHITLPDSNEPLDISPEEELDLYIKRMIINGARPAKNKGSSGLGDIETGVLFNAYRSQTISFSMGLGIRWPTGAFKKVPTAFRPLGEGITSLGLRINADYQILEGLWLSYQEQLEWGLTEAIRLRSSVVDPETLLPEGNTKPIIYKNVAPGRDLMLKANFGLGAIDSRLGPLGIFSAYFYQKKSRLKIDNVLETEQSQHLASFGVYADGRDLNIPIGIDWEQKIPLFGINKIISPSSHIFSIKAYAKF